MDTFSVLQFHFRIPHPTMHLHLPPPTFAGPPVTTFAWDFPHIVQWFPPTWKITKQVRFDGQFVAQQGHDSGLGIIHTTTPPSPLLAVTIACASYKCMFGSSSVKVEKTPAATFLPIVVPQLSCADPVPWPLGQNVASPCTVWLGMSMGDFLAGWLSIGIEMAAAALMSKYGSKIPGMERLGNLGSRFGQGFGSAAMQAAMRELGKSTMEALLGGNVKSLLTGGSIGLPYGLVSVNVKGQIQGFNRSTGELQPVDPSPSGLLGSYQNTHAAEGGGITHGAENVDAGGGEVTGMPGATAGPHGSGPDPTGGSAAGVPVCE